MNDFYLPQIACFMFELFKKKIYSKFIQDAIQFQDRKKCLGITYTHHYTN